MGYQSEKVPSDTVKRGRHAEHVAYADDKYVRCWNCGFIAHLTRDMTAPMGATIGDGVTQPSTQLNGAVLVGATSITVDSTASFATPDTGSITAFATGGRGRTTITSAAHGLKGGKVIITSTTSYDGTFYIDNVRTNYFDIRIPFVADDATGTWTVPNYIYIFDADLSAGSSTATEADGTTARADQSSTRTASTGAPRMDKVLYTAIASSTTFTTATATVLAHDDNMNVKGDSTYSGCPHCGCLHYENRS